METKTKTLTFRTEQEAQDFFDAFDPRSKENLAEGAVGCQINYACAANGFAPTNIEIAYKGK